MRPMKPVLFVNDEEITLPTKWVICSTCSGHGKHSRGVECDGGGITASEMDELGPEFMEDYFAGVYDRSCDDCNGEGKVQVVDWKLMTKTQRQLWNDQVREEREYQSICRMERMMGA